MARVTVEDCIDKVNNRFDLVLLASHRARMVSSGAQITIDRDNIIYVADRENGRVQKFDLDGKFLGEWPLGRTYSVRASGGTIWASMQPIDTPVPSPGWIVKLDRKTGKVLGSVESNGLHSLTVTNREELLTGVTSQNKVLWFR